MGKTTVRRAIDCPSRRKSRKPGQGLTSAILNEDLPLIRKIIDEIESSENLRSPSENPIIPCGGSLHRPIHYASSTGNVQIVNYFLSRGASINEPTTLAGDAIFRKIIPQTPLSIALENNRKVLAAHLRSLGAIEGRKLFRYDRQGLLREKRRPIAFLKNLIRKYIFKKAN